MAGEVSFTEGRAPIPFGRFSGYGAMVRASPFAGSADLVSLCNQALGRYQNAIDTAQAACDNQRNYLDQTIFNWATGNTSTQSICNAAAQMQINHDFYAEKVGDASTTDDQLAEILAFIGKEINISDLLDLARSTNVLTVTGRSILDAPGTVVGWGADTGSRIGSGIIGNVPWWGWAIGAAFIASQLGWNPLKSKG
jgi:hypothetical protein